MATGGTAWATVSSLSRKCKTRRRRTLDFSERSLRDLLCDCVLAESGEGEGLEAIANRVGHVVGDVLVDAVRGEGKSVWPLFGHQRLLVFS